MRSIHVFSGHHRTLSEPNPPTSVPSTRLPAPSCPQLPALIFMHYDSLDNLSPVELEDNQIDHIPGSSEALDPPSNGNTTSESGKGTDDVLSSVPTTEPTTGLADSEYRSASPSSVSSIYSQDNNHDAVAATADTSVPSTKTQHSHQPQEDQILNLNPTTFDSEEVSDAPLSEWLASTAPQGRPLRSNSKHIHFFETNGIKLRMKEHAGVLVEWVDGICLTMNLDEQLDPSRGPAVIPDNHVDHHDKVSTPPATRQRVGYRYRPSSSGASKFPPTSSRPVSLSKIDEVPLARAPSKDFKKKQNVADDWGVPSSIERASLPATVLEQLNARSRPRATRHSSDYTMSGALGLPASSVTTRPADRPLSLQLLPSTSTHRPMPLRLSTDPRTMSTPDLPSSKKQVYEMVGSPVSPVSTSTVPLSAQPDGFEMRPLSPVRASPPHESSRALQVLRKFEHKPKFQDFVSKSKDREVSVPALNTSPTTPARPQSQILSALRGTISHSLFEQSNISKPNLSSRAEAHDVAAPDLLPSPTQIRRMAQFENPIYPSLSTSEILDLPHPPRPPRQMIPETKPSQRPRSSTYAPIPRPKVPTKSNARSRPPTPPNPITELALKHQPEKHLANIPAPTPSLVSDYPHMAAPTASARPPGSSDRKRLTKPRPSSGRHRQVKSWHSLDTTQPASTASSSTISKKASSPRDSYPGSTDVGPSADKQDNSGSATAATNKEIEPTHDEPFCACPDPEPTTTTEDTATLPRQDGLSPAVAAEPEPVVVEQGHATTTNIDNTSRASSPARHRGQSSDVFSGATFHEVTTSRLKIAPTPDAVAATDSSDDTRPHVTTSYEVRPASPITATINTRPYRPIPTSRRTSYHDMTTGADIVSPTSLNYYSTTHDQNYDEASSNASYYALVTAKPHSSAVAVADMPRAGSMRGGGSLRGRSLSAGRSPKVANANVNVSVAERMGSREVTTNDSIYSESFPVARVWRLALGDDFDDHRLGV